VWEQKMKNAESLLSWHLQTDSKKGNRDRKLTFIKHIPLIKISQARRREHLALKWDPKGSGTVALALNCGVC